MSDITYNFDNMLAERIGPGYGITAEELEQAIERSEAGHAAVQARRAAGKLHFMDLPQEREVLARLSEIRESRPWVKHFVVVGIGGSALGSIALDHTFSSTTTSPQVQFHCFDNVDPEELHAFFQTVDLRETLFNIVSKSGSTLETAATFLLVRQELKKKLGTDYKKHLIFTTSNTVGLLREVSAAEGIEMLVHPDDVGGRFTVLSVVGLFPAVWMGIDVEKLLDGAARMDERCQEPFASNPGQQFAALQYASYVFKKQNVVTMMPYAFRLKKWPEWFKQLWAESLGKQYDRQGKEIRVGQTPTQALGSTDQHSQIQLFNCGSRDRNIVFLQVEQFDHDLIISETPDQVDELAYLQDKSFSQIMTAEYEGTRGALVENQVANSTLVLPDISAYTIGQLIYLLEYATAVSGELYNIDAFNQPGVERGKEIAYKLLGRAGY